MPDFGMRISDRGLTKNESRAVFNSRRKFDRKKADEYFRKVNDKVANLIDDIVRKWDVAGV
jgi:hypothetical protein